MASGFITLDQVATHTAVLAVACSRCDRAGRHGVDPASSQTKKRSQ
jgi:hypothetical protein